MRTSRGTGGEVKAKVLTTGDNMRLLEAELNDWLATRSIEIRHIVQTVSGVPNEMNHDRVITVLTIYYDEVS